MTDIHSVQIRKAWQGFHDAIDELRPQLYRFCRNLTRSPYDAEDLVQDALAKAFLTAGGVFDRIENPRAWLFQIASNVWIDRVRRAREMVGEFPEIAAPVIPVRETREAAGTLLTQLAPQERAAVVLKDVFDFSLEEIASVLSTTPNSVKAALHRGRGKLENLDSAEVRTPPPTPVLDAFCAAFNARDLEGLRKLLTANTTCEMVGSAMQYGDRTPAESSHGMLRGMLGVYSGVEPRFREDYVEEPARVEVREHRGAHIALVWCKHTVGEAVRAIIRVFDDGEGHVGRLRIWFWADDFLAEVCRELNVPFRVNGYRYWGPTSPHDR